MKIRLEPSRRITHPASLRNGAHLLLPVAIACAFASSILPSVPALRQDWAPYPFGEAARAVFWSGTSGWDVSGIGAPMPYPQAYLVAPLIALLRLALGAEGALIVFTIVVGALCAYGGRALARALGGNAVGAVAAALFLTFNPWTFVELVAGHTYMLLAYAATICLVAEAVRRPPRPAVIVLCLVAALTQIQFALIDTVIVAIVGWRYRLAIPVAVAALMWLPSIIGILAEHGALAATPFTLSWETNQSVTPLGALALNGYFAQYGDQFSGVRSMPVAAIALLGLYGALVKRRSWPMIGVTALTLFFLAAAMGARGPFGALFSWSVLHVAATGVFRELYDLLGYAVIGYALCALAACDRVASWIFLAAAGALAATWWWTPPSHLWVPSSQLPVAAVTAPENTRFALIPAFQPVSLDGRGSGADPDLYVRDADVTPLNQYLATYPADAALAAFVRTGNAEPLRALSVSRIVERPYLRSARNALAEQWALPPAPARRGLRSGALSLQPLPELSLIAAPAVGSVDDRLGSGNIFFGDIDRGSFARVMPSSDTVDARRAWVDARLVFAERPELAQGFGGAVTTSPAALLPLRGGVEALVWVRGALWAQSGTLLTRTTRGYEWIAVPSDVRAATCSGLCVVAGQGTPPKLQENPPPRSYRAVDFFMSAPWMLHATLPAGPAGALRYNAAYDGAWAAYVEGRRLRHVRLDVAVNGWLVPQRSRSARVLIVDRVAAAQAAAELLVACVLVVLGATEVRAASMRMYSRDGR